MKSLLDRIVVVFAVQQNMLIVAVTLRLDYPSDFPIKTIAFQPLRLDKAQFMLITDCRSEDTNCRDIDRPCNFNTRTHSGLDQQCLRLYAISVTPSADDI